MPIKQMRLDFLDDISGKGVYVTNKGNLNFTNSVYEKGSGDAKLLTKIWNVVKKRDSIKMGEGLIQKEKLGNILYKGKISGDITSGEAFAKKFQRSITKEVHRIDPDLAQLDDVFSGLADLTGKTQKVTKEGAEDLLRKSLGSGSRKWVNMVKDLEKMGKKYNLKTMENIVAIRRLAQASDDAFNVDMLTRPTGIVGRMGAAGAPAARGDIVGTVRGIGEAVRRTPSQVAAMQKLAKASKVTPIIDQFLPLELKRSMARLSSGLISRKQTAASGAAQGMTKNIFDMFRTE